MHADIDKDCVQTFEQLSEELKEVEQKLAEKLKLSNKNIRSQLFALDSENELIEDELVSLWHELYAVYITWKD